MENSEDVDCVELDSSDDEIEEEEEEEAASSLDDSENEDDDEDAAAREGKIEMLEKMVEENVYNYDPHVSLIKLLKADGDLEKLRKARERMSNVFPLTEELWLGWIRDEMKVAFNEEEKQAVIDLFERAVKDYLAVEIWLEYGQYCIGLIGKDEGVAKCRDVFERALTAAGIHVAKGSILWEVYREFENAMLGTLQASSDKEMTPEYQEKLKEQTIRILNLFKRQLSIPLLDMERSYEELKEFVTEEIDPNITLAYQKATSKLSKIIPYEKKLLSEDPPHLESYLAYIEYEKGEGEPTRIQCLYERALAENCLVPDLWNSYICYLTLQLKIGTIILPVCERAIKNCPWSVTLWQAYLRAMERYEEPIGKIKEVAERALAAGFTSADEFRELWMTYLEYLRRQIDWNEEYAEKLQTLRATFERAYNHLTESFGVDGDPNCTVLQYWARIEARYCKSMDKAREIWNDIMQLGHAKTAQMWLQYIELERNCGNSKHVRKLFSRAIHGTSDWPESIGEAWLNFERDEGSVDQWEIALDKYEKRMKVIQERRLKEAEQQNPPERATRSKHGDNDATPTRRKDFKKKANLASDEKRTFKNVVPDSQPVSNLDEKSFKRPLPPAPKRKDEKIGEEEIPASKRPKIDDQKTAAIRGIKPGSQSDSKNERTIFLSNLAYDADENKIKEIFSEVGEITDLRLVKDYRGRSKGYCYVEYASWDLAIQALKKDRTPIDGRPIFVSKCEEKTRSSSSNTSKFKYTTGLEKNKLFVKGLPFSMTEEELKETFGTFGSLQDARLVTYRNGHSKGIAFVEYKDEATAAAALMKTDGMAIGSHVISVAISNPPQRRERELTQEKLLASLGAGPLEFGSRGRNRPHTSFMPRAVSRSQATTLPSKDVTNGGEEKKQITNAEFRNMFLKK